MRKIIFDTDPGIDDAIAMMVLKHFCGDRVGIVLTSYGNVSSEHTTNNALTMLKLMNWHVPVVKGADKSKSPFYKNAAYIHGEDGLAGLGQKFPVGSAFTGDFVKKVYDIISQEKEVDYIAAGPLTNLALLIKRFPDIKSKIKRVVIMGGGIDLGNVTDDAEFNIYCDPISADFVFNEISDLALIPLNITCKVVLSREKINEITKEDAESVMHKILMANYDACINYGDVGAVMHDSVAALYYILGDNKDSGLFKEMKCGIDVDFKNKYGKTTINSDRLNVTLVTDVNEKRIIDFIAKCLE